MQSAMSHNFAQVPPRNIGRSTFDRSRPYKTTIDAGKLYPFYFDEVLPGDTFSVNTEIFMRMSSQLNKPIMDNMKVTFFYFYVANRLLWEHWKAFMGEKRNPTDSTTYICPTMTAPAVTGFTALSLQDYLGMPVGIPGIEIKNTFHMRAYNLIWNEWFRDENLQDSVVNDVDDGPDSVADYVLLSRGKRHDYFTACLPWPQKGAAVTLPLGTSAPVIGNGMTLGMTDGTNYYGTVVPAGSYQPFKGSSTRYGSSVGVGVSVQDNAVQNAIVGVTTDPTKSGIIADLSNATAATINSLRLAFQGQLYQELDARSGTRYTEMIRSHFGVISPDSRLQRPEYLGGGSFFIKSLQVANTSNTSTGTLGAYAMAGGETGGFTQSFTEHGVLLGLVQISADLTYQQGLPRMYSRSTKYDFYDPVFANLGEQAVLNKEIYCQGTSADDDVFGYQERWAEYRYGQALITGALRSSYATSLDVYHLSQDFSSLPELNEVFITDNPPISRIVAVTTEPQFIMDCYIHEKATRPMPVYSIPGRIDHL